MDKSYGKPYNGNQRVGLKCMLGVIRMSTVTAPNLKPTNQQIPEKALPKTAKELRAMLGGKRAFGRGFVDLYKEGK
jgi:hypothetical protein